MQCFAVRLQAFVQKIERESHDLKDMILCLLQLVKDKNDADQGRGEYAGMD